MSRRQAFARTPRGGATNSPAQARRIAQDLAPTTRIDRAFIERMNNATVDPNLRDVLTRTSGTLTFYVSSQGNVETRVIDRTNRVIADVVDIKSVTAMNTFIQTERRSADKEKVTTTLKKALCALAQVSEASPGPAEPTELHDNSFAAIYKPCESLVRILVKNTGQFPEGELANPLDDIVREHARASAVRIRNGIVAYLVEKFRNKSSTKKLNEFFLERHVPLWVVTRLTQSFIDLRGSKAAMSTLYFPKNQASGMMLSYKEIRSRAFCNDQGRLLSNSASMIEFFRTKEALLPFLNIPQGSDLLEDDGVKFNELLDNVPLMVVPPGMNLADVSAINKSNGMKGFSWNLGRGVGPKDILKLLGTVHKRAFVLALPDPRRQYTYLQRKFSGFVYNQNAAERDVYAQFQTWYSALDDADRKNAELEFGNFIDPVQYARSVARGVLADWFSLLLGVPKEPASQEWQAILLGLQLEQTGGAYTFRTNSYAPLSITTGLVPMEDAWGHFSSTIAAMNLESTPIQNLLRTVYVSKGKEVKVRPPNFNTVRTQLSPLGLTLVNQLKEIREHTLAEKIRLWLISFSSIEVQGAVSGLLIARFSAFFDQELAANPDDYVGIMDFHGYTGEGNAQDDDPEANAADEITFDDTEGPDVPPPA